MSPASSGTSLVAQTVTRLPTVRETWVWSLGQEDPLEKEMATHSRTLAWKIPWTEKRSRLQSMGSQRVGHDWVTSFHFLSTVPPAKSWSSYCWYGHFSLFSWCADLELYIPLSCFCSNNHNQSILLTAQLSVILLLLEGIQTLVKFLRSLRVMDSLYFKNFFFTIL